MWINPLVLSGLAAVVIPLAIHWHRQRKNRSVQWAAMHLLAKLEQQHKRTLSINNWLLLLIRMVVVGLIVIMLARPFLSNDNARWLSNTPGSQSHIIVLDDTASMFATVDTQTRWHHGINQIQSFILQLSQDRPQDEVTLMCLSSIREPILEQISPLDPRWNRHLERLRGNKFPKWGNGWLVGLTQLRKKLNDQKSVSPALYLVSDGLTVDWDIEKDGKALFGLLGEMRKNKRLSDISFIHINNGQVSNLKLKIETPLWAILGKPKQFNGVLENSSDFTSNAGELVWRVDDGVSKRLLVPPLLPGQTWSFSIQESFSKIGDNVLHWSLPADAYPIDNHVSSVCHVKSSHEVLIISPDSSMPNRKKSAFYVDRALAPLGQGNNSCTIKKFNSLPSDNSWMKSTDLLVLITDEGYSTDQFGKIRKWVMEGGSLLVIPGADQSTTNSLWQIALESISGNSLEVTSNKPGIKKMYLGDQHPSSEALQHIGPSVFKHALWETFYQLSPTKGNWIPLIKESNSSNNGLMWVTSIGKGVLLAAAGPTNAESGNWVLHPSFVLWAQSILKFSAQSYMGERSVFPKTSWFLKHDNSSFKTNITQTNYRKTQGESIFSGEQKLTASYSDIMEGYGVDVLAPEFLGLIRFNKQRLDGKVETYVYAINPDQNESEMVVVGEKFKLHSKALGVKYSEFDWPPSTNMHDRSNEFWRIFWVLLVILLIVEQSYAWLLRYQRNKSSRRRLA